MDASSNRVRVLLQEAAVWRDRASDARGSVREWLLSNADYFEQSALEEEMKARWLKMDH